MADVLDGVPVFCSIAEVETKLGSLGIDIQILSDVPNGLEGAITQATDDIRMACHKFPFEALQQSRIVRNWCKVLAAYLSTGNGGEPHSESLKTEAERVYATLQMFLVGDLNVIPDLPVVPGKEDKGGIPVVSNIAIDPTMNPSIRVNRPASTGTPAGYPQAPYYPSDHRRGSPYGG